MSLTTPFIGIDFGTSNSKMAWYNPKTNQAEILKNRARDERTPSVIYVHKDGSIDVGRSAEAMQKDSQERANVIRSIKRNLEVNAPISVPNCTDPLEPLEVVAAILHKLKDDAEQHLHFSGQQVKRAVITHPVSFNAQEKEILRNAAISAGFVEVEFLQEPVAAALAYTRLLPPRIVDNIHYILVYDLGGGTFDLALLKRESGGEIYPALPHQGIRRCGGDYFDEALHDYHTGPRPGLRDLNLLKKCRDQKEELSFIESTVLESIEVQNEGKVDRTTFERLIQDKVRETIKETETLVEVAKQKGFIIDTVLLIGGSTRIPLIERLLKENLELRPQNWEQGDNAVALGAAYHGHNLWGPENTYRKHLKTAWDLILLDQETVDQLAEKAHQFILGNELTNEQIEYIEQEVMHGDVKENVLQRQTDYRTQLIKMWTDRLLDESKVRQLTDLAIKLRMRPGEPREIERNVLGDLKEIVRDRQANYRANVQASGSMGKGDLVKLRELASRLNLPDDQVKAIEDSIVNDTQSVYQLDNSILQLQTTFFQGERGIRSLAFSRDGLMLSCCDLDNKIYIWQLSDSSPQLIDGVWQSGINSLGSLRMITFCPDGLFLLSAGYNHNITCWPINGGASFTLKKHSGKLNTLAFSKDGSMLASGSDDGTVILWNWQERRPLATFDRKHKGGVNAVVFSPDGQYLASGGADKLIRLWQTHERRLLTIFDKHTESVTSLAFSPKGTYLASGNSKGIIQVWQVSPDFTNVDKWKDFSGSLYAITTLAFSPAEDILVGGSSQNMIKVWDVHNWQLRQTIPEAHKFSVSCVVFHPDGRMLASSGGYDNDKTIKFWQRVSS